MIEGGTDANLFENFIYNMLNKLRPDPEMINKHIAVTTTCWAKPFINSKSFPGDIHSISARFSISGSTTISNVTLILSFCLNSD